MCVYVCVRAYVENECICGVCVCVDVCVCISWHMLNVSIENTPG